MLSSVASHILGYFHFYYGVAITAILAGLIMAYLTEDGTWDSSNTVPTSPKTGENLKASKNIAVRRQELFVPKNFIGKCFRNLYSLTGFLIAATNELEAWYWGPDPIDSSSIVAKVFEKLHGLLQKFQFICEAKTVFHLAQSKSHYCYLLEKRVLGIEMVEGEEEQQSYLSIKRFLGDKWPFMWEVDKVKEDKINCAGFSCYPMSSYSYLNLLRDQRVQDRAIACAKEWATGSHGPRMLGGNGTILRQLEKQIASFFGREDTLLCSAGFLATMSACAGCPSERDIVYADAKAHASLRTGLKVSSAKVVYFKHNDFKLLDQMLKKSRKHYNHAWIVIESVYSMDGDIADFPACSEVAKKYDCKIIVDEAHGLGVLGPHGRGIEDYYNMPGTATIICGTFSKSVASVGGYITGSKDWISFLDFYAPGNVFSAPLPAYNAGAALASFEIMDKEPELMWKAQSNSRYLRDCLASGMGLWPPDYPEDHKYVMEGNPATTVIPLIFPDDVDRVMRVATGLKKKGFMVSAVAYPACPVRKPRFRLTATSAYSRELIEDFVKALVPICVSEPPSATCLEMAKYGL